MNLLQATPHQPSPQTTGHSSLVFLDRRGALQTTSRHTTLRCLGRGLATGRWRSHFRRNAVSPASAVSRGAPPLPRPGPPGGPPPRGRRPAFVPSAPRGGGLRPRGRVPPSCPPQSPGFGAEAGRGRERVGWGSCSVRWGWRPRGRRTVRGARPSGRVLRGGQEVQEQLRRPV